MVTDLRRGEGPHDVHLSCGWAIAADKVVLALGNPPPRRRRELEQWGDRYLPDPWADDLAGAVRGSREVLLLGTGLTMVDVVAALHEASPDTRFTAVSRHGLLPTAHKRGSLRLHDIFSPGHATLDGVIERVRDRVLELEDVGGDWRDVFDSLRAGANELWRGFSHEDQDRFAADLARHWEVRRHRMSPGMADHIARLQDAGTLRIARVGEVDAGRFDRIINCTGPSPVPTRGWNRLVDALLHQGVVRPHRLGLGLDLTPDGCVIDAAGRANPDVFAVGAARRGIEWEVAAVPDLRSQAAQLAVHIARSLAPTGHAHAVAEGAASA